tara:strand:- start:55036 stop:55422 length:387 start_codon:yes stop_codon:yes gene_type:complete
VFYAVFTHKSKLFNTFNLKADDFNMAKFGNHHYTMTVFLKRIVIILLIAFSQSSLACEGNASSTIIAINQAEQVVHLSHFNAHDYHQSCKGQCCELGNSADKARLEGGSASATGFVAIAAAITSHYLV